MKELNLTLSHVKKSFTRPVLTDINLNVTNDSYITILGKSGSGKSTLLNILGLVENYDSGEYYFNGTLIQNHKDYSRLRLKNIGFIFQSYNLIPTLTCLENIQLPNLYSHQVSNQNITDLIELLDIGHLLSQRVNTLSGGEKQRVAIARSLMMDPCLLLADEPTGNLDKKNKEIIYQLLQREHENGRGVILITHDQSTASHAKTVYTLEGGMLHEYQS